MESIGQFLRHIRKATRVSQTLLGKRIGGSRQMISNVEKDRREPKRDEIVEFASTLRVRPSSFFEELPEPLPKDPISANLRQKKSDIKWNEHDAWELSELRTILEGLPPSQTIKDGTHFPTLCREAREQLGLENCFPVDVLNGCISSNIHFFFTAFEKISGAMILSNDRSRVGLVANSDHPDERSYWTIAHELGHWVLGHELQELVVGEGQEEFGRFEREADAFAGEFLLPSRQLLKIAEEKIKGANLAEEIYELSVQCMVSFRAMLKRLNAFNVISPLEAEVLLGAKPTQLEEKLQLKAQRECSFQSEEYCDKVAQQLVNDKVLPEGWEEDFGDKDEPYRGLCHLRRLQEAALREYISSTSLEERATNVTEVYESIAIFIASEFPWG